MKTCKKCGTDKPTTEFYNHRTTADRLYPSCKKCIAKVYGPAVAERARRDRKYFQDIKVARGCIDCGWTGNPVALDFDHLPGTVKRYRVACMAGMKRENIDAEIAKCEVVCANCHRIRTNERLLADGRGEEILTDTELPTLIPFQNVPD